MENSEVIGAFSDEQAARITGVSLNQLRDWDSDGFFHASFGETRPHVPYGRLYSFRDLVSLQVLHDLRNRKKIPLGHLKDVSRKLAHLGEGRWTATTLYVLGKRVVFENPATAELEEVVSRQRVLNIPLRVVIRNTRNRIAALNDRSAEVGHFQQRRYVAQNERVFAGTRIPLATVLQFAEAGYSQAQIRREYPVLELEEIGSAIAQAKGTVAA